LFRVISLLSKDKVAKPVCTFCNSLHVQDYMMAVWFLV
jgi:hypothetical protein